MSAVSDLYSGILKTTGGVVGQIPLDGSRLGLGVGNGVNITVPYSANTTLNSAKAGADNGQPFAIDWFGNGTAVSGNPGLVNAPEPGDTPATGAGVDANGAVTQLVDSFSGGIARITIIILGFIFVAVGLSMFKSAGGMVAAVALPP